MSERQCSGVTDNFFPKHETVHFDSEECPLCEALNILSDLDDAQNGPPLIKYESDWYKAMAETTRVLGGSPASINYYRDKIKK